MPSPIIFSSSGSPPCRPLLTSLKSMKPAGHWTDPLTTMGMSPCSDTYHMAKPRVTCYPNSAGAGKTFTLKFWYRCSGPITGTHRTGPFASRVLCSDLYVSLQIEISQQKSFILDNHYVQRQNNRNAASTVGPRRESHRRGGRRRYGPWRPMGRRSAFSIIQTWKPWTKINHSLSCNQCQSKLKWCSISL
jgi:hypothetical protein